MRLKVFHAPSAPEAMAQVRDALGDEAVIVATRELPSGEVRITAAVENEEEDLAALLQPATGTPVEGLLAETLAYHEVPEGLCARLLAEVRRAAIDEPIAALAQALGATIAFQPLAEVERAPLLVVGPPGAGKTAVVAKLAARAVLAGRPLSVISTDLRRAGGIAQLEALIAPLGLEPQTAEGPGALRSACAACEDGLVLVDTTGANPFRGSELAPLAALAEAASAEVLAVLPAGLGGADCAEIAANLRALGARRLVATRLDAARRLGGILAAAEAGLALAEVGISPLIGRGLSPLQPAALARLLVRHRLGAAPPPAPD